MSAPPFQLLPDLTAEEYAELRASIAEFGVMVPIIVDEDGEVIDGHHRQRIADELDVDYPVVVIPAGSNDGEKRTMALTLNVDRRHLDRKQKQELVTTSILADPSMSDRRHAHRTGTSPSTVAKVRADLEARGLVSKLDTRVGADGVEQPAGKPKNEGPSSDAPVPPGAVEPDDDAAPNVEGSATPGEGAAPEGSGDVPSLDPSENDGEQEAEDPYPELTYLANAGKSAGTIRDHLKVIDPQRIAAVAPADERDSWTDLAATLRRSADALDAAFTTTNHLRSVQ